MSVFIDTSAFLAILNAKDKQHHDATIAWEHLIASRETLISSNYVVVETVTLLQRRFGIDVAQSFQENVYPILEVEWVDKSIHHAGIATVFTASRRRLSLVDCVSFEVMRRQGITRAFCFDAHFAEQGFECIPAKSNAS